VHVIGHPAGLPVKVASGKVTRNSDLEVFETSYDALGGNSGSPVFNSVTHEVEGIHVRGMAAQEVREREGRGCNEYMVWAVEQAAEVSTRTSAFVSRLGPGWQEVDDNPATKAIAVGAPAGPVGPALYQLHDVTGAVWRYTGTPMVGWELLGANPSTVEVATDGVELYQRQGVSGSIWRYTGIPLVGWEQVGGNPRTKTIVASRGELYQLQSDGLLWRYTGTPMTGWELLDNNRRTVAIAHDGLRLYQLHSVTGAVWRYTGTPMVGWQQLDDNPETKAIHAAGRQLYQRTSRPKSRAAPARASIKRLVA
jgi:hypothetical protein